ncbi:Transmembrane protein 208-like protein [Auxenochlorella protothecoides]|uniref:Transmembrane protein 208-like protein n=1 Tax=Auxenochlorella protothecoides TaxID=3075 RepID=A0A087SBT5_AUXPR|nr:Transmembrane protein 208-like protein [Auxenochlorella protothecoides]KFM23189.1 Transmembrane protein 208-like protein [Auxenochlorella protothecoides]RMZ53483.1 hypothetical protein APUTEX25_003305 [Auxenochlorella protothecoides]|eukprot:RMZ53483.1 hypothetical protein APUTEX25_003305 [Auxenochlorella protothecoides]
MAKAGDKKRLEQNADHIRKLKIIVIVANVAWLVVRFLLRRSTVTWTSYAALGLTSLVYAICYPGIATALAPHYSPSGELVYAGADLAQGGVLSYYHDLLYITAFVQLGSMISKWAWLAFIAVPAYCAYLLVIHVLLPYWSAPRADTTSFESEADKRRREKRERQTARAQKFSK